MCPLWHLHTHRFEQIFGQRLATYPGSKCWNLAFAVVGPLREPRKICYSFRRFKGVGLIAFRSSFVSALSQPNHSPLSWFVFPASLAQKMGGFSAGSKGNWINIWQVGEWMPTNLLWGTDSSKLRDESGCEKSMHECDFQHIFHINCQQLGMSTASSVILYAQSAGRTTNQHHPTNPPTITSGWCASVSSESVGYMCLYWVDPVPLQCHINKPTPAVAIAVSIRVKRDRLPSGER